MDMKWLKLVRPKGETCEAIQAALDAAQTAWTDAAGRVGVLEQARAGLLLDGTDRDVERGEAELTLARADVERATIMLGALTQRLAEAKRRDKMAALSVAREEANALSGSFAAFVANKYPKLAREIAAGLQIEKEAVKAVDRFHVLYRDLTAAEREEVAVPSEPRHWEGHAAHFGELVALPDPAANDPSGSAIWSRAHANRYL